jgi:NADP-dependent 3-hydroxy acid dehydrogenase YdfG
LPECEGKRHELNGKTIVITGASSGIGAETARLARAQGAMSSGWIATIR